MSIFNRKEEPPDPHPYWPKFCKADGLKLIESKHVDNVEYDTQTGKKVRKFRRGRYCPDWKVEGPVKHTEHWANIFEYEQEDVDDE